MLMPYFQIEQIHERKGEKVALMLTAENMAGLVIGVLPLYLISGGWSFWLRATVMVLGGVLGVLATLDIGGLTPAERVIWLVRGFIRLRIYGNRITPEQLPGAAPAHREPRVLRANGPVRVLPQAITTHNWRDGAHINAGQVSSAIPGQHSPMNREANDANH
jgi:hypothetical protein